VSGVKGDWISWEISHSPIPARKVQEQCQLSVYILGLRGEEKTFQNLPELVGRLQPAKQINVLLAGSWETDGYAGTPMVIQDSLE
jgi:hypothetical protein